MDYGSEQDEEYIYDRRRIYGSMSGSVTSLGGSEKHVQDTAGNTQPAVYKSRWYILIMVSIASVLNNFLWATWGPISDSAKLVYHWNENTLFWVVNSGNITGFLFIILGCYLVDVKGKLSFYHLCHRVRHLFYLRCY